MNDTTSFIFKVLRDSLFFKDLPTDVLTSLAEIAVLKEYEKNEEIFYEGEKALGFFVILDGFVKIYKISSKGKEQIIHIFGSGEIFAEVVLAGLKSYPANAKALTQAKLAFFEKNRFLNLIQRNPQMALVIIGVFAHRLKNLLQIIENLTLREAPERLLCYLWDLSGYGSSDKIKLNISKSQLAFLLGITPETLSRIFQKFKDEGLLEIKQRELRLKNLDKWKSLIKTLT